MSTEVGKLYYDLSIDDSKLKSGLDSADGKVGGFSSKIGKLGGVIAGAFAGQQILNFGKSMVSAFTESEDAIAQTNAVLKSTGGTAGVTATMVDELSSSLQNSTRFSDEQARSAQNMLLTFTNIGKDVFPDATQAVADMATAMGTDLTQTSIQVGKALQDPVLGVTALQRVGVRLTESQKEVVEQLVATGDTAGAQRVIIAELTKEFGGSAKAAGETFAGKLQILKNRLNDVQEIVGQKLIGALMWLGTTISAVTKWFDEHRLVLAMVAGAVATIVIPLIFSLIGFLATLIANLILTGAAWLIAFGPILLIGALIAGIAYLVITNWDTLKGWFTSFFEWFGSTWNSLAETISKPFKTAWEWINEKFTGVVNWFKELAGKIDSVAGTIKDAITKPFKEAFNLIARAWNNTAGKISFEIPSWVPGGIGGNKFAMPKIPEFRKGVENFGGGLAFVHKGEALVNMAPGTSVIKASDAKNMSSGGKVEINIGQINNREDADYLLNKINRNYNLAGMGLSPVGE